jgi:mono/diheme cytochrome c family protein
MYTLRSAAPWLRRAGQEAALIGLGLATFVAVVACDTGTSAATTPLPESTLKTGEKVFNTYCAVCHPGGGAGSGPSLILSFKSDAQRRTIVRQGHRPMPAFSSADISDAELDALLGYIRTLK